MSETLVSIEAEQALLGAVMYDPAALPEAGGVRALQFFEPFHQRLWRQISDAVAKGDLPDPTLLSVRMREDPSFGAMGGGHYLANLVDHAPPVSRVRHYARAVIELALRRDALRLLGEAGDALSRPGEGSAYDALSGLRRSLDEVENEAASEEAAMIRAPELARSAFEAMSDAVSSGRARGALTGLRCIDRRLGGILPGKLIVIGGRPGMGKTALARAIAHGCAAKNPDLDVLFAGIEMGPEEMMQRELSALTWAHGDGIEYNTMARAKLTPLDLMTIHRVMGGVPPNLVFDDCPRLTVDDVRRKLWALGRKRRVACVVIDYLQLMQRPLAKGRNEASVLGEMTSGLKQIARQSGAAVILLSQLSRQVEARDDKRPQLADLRESGAIEQDADVVLFPFREHYYLAKAEPPETSIKHGDWEISCELVRHRLDVICAKQRQGPEGWDRQEYWPEFDAIVDTAQ